MANTILTVKQAAGIVARSAAMILHDNLKFLKTTRNEPDDYWSKNYESVRPGDTIQIKTPARFTTRTNATYSAQDFTQSNVALAVTNQYGVDVDFNSAQLTTDLGIKSFVKEVADPAMKQLASKIENAVMATLPAGVFNLVGTAGTSPNALSTVLGAKKLLDKNLAPMADRYCLLNADAAVGLVDALKGLFHSSSEIKEQYEEGTMGYTAGMKFQQNELIPTHTTGTMAGGAAAAVNGAAQTGATLAINGMTGSATITKGTTFTIAGCYMVHPETKATTSTLQQFVVTADITLAAGAGTLAISPSLNSAATATQNIAAAPTSGNLLTFYTNTASTAYPQNLVYHKDAVRFISLPMYTPNSTGVDFVAQETVEGLTVRFIRQYLTSDDKLHTRFDVLWGSAIVRPEHICRITG